MSLGLIFAVIALILEIIHWATTKDSSLLFYALVLLTLGMLLGGIAIPAVVRRP